MNKRQRKKQRKKEILRLAETKEFKSPEAKQQWIKDTLRGEGSIFTRYYLKGEPESPFIFHPYRHLTIVPEKDKAEVREYDPKQPY